MVVVQMKMVDSRRNHILVVDLQMKSQVVVDEEGSDMMIGLMIGEVIVLLGIVEVIVVVVVVVVVVVESAGVEVVADVVAVVEEEALEADTAAEER